jgi:hypothetical protein
VYLHVSNVTACSTPLNFIDLITLMLLVEQCDVIPSRHLIIFFTQMLVMINQLTTFANEKIFGLVDLDQRVDGNTKLDIGWTAHTQNLTRCPFSLHFWFIADI